MKLIQCARCGGELKEENGRYVCAYCHATYEDDTLERAYAELKNSLESVVGTQLNEMTIRERERSLANLRKELWKEVHEKYVNSKKITGICREIKKISPDDFSANFYELMNDESDESRRVCEFLNKVDEKKYADYVEDVVDFVVKSLKVEYLTSLNGLVERAYKNDLQTFSRVMTKIEAEAEKVENGLYVLEKPRDVFVAYSSKDVAVVNELVSCLEEQGIECFVAMRNLQHGAKSVENYESALETAMDNCKIFLFVSSKNSRSIACDAMKREIPYIKKKDLEFKPEYRNDYDKMPEKYRKPRIQYRIDDVKTMAVDRQVKEFFGTLQWRSDLDSVVEQVGEYLSREVEEEPAQAPVNEEKLYEQFKKRMQEETRIAEEQRKAEEKRKAEQVKAIADFEIVNGVLVKYKGKGGDVIIPNGVTEIGKSAFQECKNLTSVVIPNGVTKIADRAFGWCDNLKTVQIPSSVKSIGERSFTTCKSLERVTIPDGVISLGEYAFDWCDSLKAVEMADSVTDMGVAVFSVCKNLEKVKLSKNLTRIERESFSYCESLKEIKIPEKVNYIGDKAFMKCTSLESVVIPNGVTKIADQAFGWCDKLKSVSIPGSVKSIGKQGFSACLALEKVVLPHGVESLGERAFDWIENLKAVEMADSVTDMGVAVFSVCKNLEKVKLSKNLTRIETESFSYCENLKEINIPEKVNYIGEKAFAVCKKLEKVVIPKTALSIGAEAFGWCENLKIYAEANAKQSGWHERWNGERPVFWNYKAGAGTSVTPKTETQNPDFEIVNGVLKKYNGKGGDVVIPDGVTEIGGKVFFARQSLLSIKIPQSVTKIGVHAFFGCKNLTSVKFSNGVENIGEFAFSNCENLETVKIPNSVTSIGRGAFMSCKRLQEVILPNELISMGSSVFMECSALKSIKFPKNMSEIPNQTCTDCYSLKSVILPNKLQSIGEIAFRNCGFLETIVIPKTVTQILGGAFLKCSSLKIYTEIKEKDKPAYNFDTGDCPVVWGYKPLFGGFGVKK